MIFDYTGDIPKGMEAQKILNYKKIAGKECQDVDLKAKTLYKQMHKLGWELTKTCLENDGIGLAAPQIGVFKNVFITVGFVKPDFWGFDGSFHMYINPKLTVEKKWGEISTSFPEGCLSVPGETYNIHRMRNISIDYYYFDKNKKLKRSMEKLTGYPSRVFQHEFDHLLGTNIVELYDKQNKKSRRGRPPTKKVEPKKKKLKKKK